LDLISEKRVVIGKKEFGTGGRFHSKSRTSQSTNRGEKATAAAWKTIPSTFVFGRHDRAIDPAELLFMAHRAHGRFIELNASHLGLISHAAAVAKVIEETAR